MMPSRTLDDRGSTSFFGSFSFAAVLEVHLCGPEAFASRQEAALAIGFAHAGAPEPYVSDCTIFRASAEAVSARGRVAAAHPPANVARHG